MKIWISKLLIRKIKALIGNPNSVNQFEYCVKVLLNHHCTLQHLFELFHEFGHYSKAVELNGNVTLLKVSPFLFRSDGRKLSYERQEDPSTSMVLCSFETDDALLDTLRSVAYEGMRFSQSVLFLSLVSLPSFVFCLVNSPLWKWYRYGSDQYLIHDYLISYENACHFNFNAKCAAHHILNR